MPTRRDARVLARSCALSLVALASGCSALRAAHHAPRPVPAPTTCVDERPPRAVTIEPRELVTVDRGVRWLLARDQLIFAGLAWLRADGEPGFVALETVDQLKNEEFGPWVSCSAEGEGAVRCFSSPDQNSDGTWAPLTSVRVELSDTPRVGAPERWDEAFHERVDRVASDGTRALTIHHDIRYERSEQPRLWRNPVARAAVLTLWDTATRRPVAAPPVRIDGTLEVLTAWCAGTCTLVGLHWDRIDFRTFGTPARLLAVTVPGGRIRTLARAVTETVIDDAVAIVRSGDAVVLAWRDRRSLKLVALDRRGRIRGRAHLPMGLAGDHVALDDGLLGFRRSRDHDWQVLAISPRAAVRGRSASAGDAVGLVGARLGDGVLLAQLSMDVSYSEGGGYGFHNWRARVEHRYLHATTPTDWRSLLGDHALDWGEGRGGYDAAWLTRPDRAAILLWATGDAQARPQFIPVRKPCP